MPVVKQSNGKKSKKHNRKLIKQKLGDHQEIAQSKGKFDNSLEIGRSTSNLAIYKKQGNPQDIEK